MIRRLSLAHLTAIDLPPPALIEAAARAGFDAVGLRLIRVTDTSPGYPLMTDAALMRATKAALAQTGIAVNDVEFVRIEPGTDVLSIAPFLDAGAELGAREVICAPYDADLSRLADRLGALSALARPRGLGLSLEFFPWTVVPDPATALRVVEKAGPEVGILVDALHVDRCGAPLDQLAAIPATRLRMAHLCDAPVHPPYSTEDLLHAARAERLPPGEGQIDLATILAVLPRDLPLALEVPMQAAMAQDGVHAVLRRIVGAARRLVRKSDVAPICDDAR